MINLVLLAVFAVCVAFLWNEGMWGNAITCINLVIAAMLASNYFEPLAAWLDGQMPSYTYLWDYLALWGLFAVCFSILRFTTDKLSRYRVKFKLPVEHAGRVVFAVFAGWIMVCFTTMTLHTAPLARTAFRGSFQVTAMSNNFLKMAPDRKWLAFLQSRSRGALSRGDSQAPSPHEADQGKRVFDPQSEFIVKYGTRRLNFEDEPEVRVLRD